MYVGKYPPNNIDRSIDGNANWDGELESIEHGDMGIEEAPLLCVGYAL